MDETAHLIIKVSSDEVAGAKEKLKGLGFEAQRAEKATGGFSAAFGKLGPIIAGVTAALATAALATKKIIDVTGVVEEFEGRLKTVTGSAENAKLAFDSLLVISDDMHTGFEDTTKAFINLAQNGLDPSRKALESYANIALSLGVSMESVADAVVSASSGQFRALQQFGIKAIQETDGLTLVFRGTATKIKGDADSIQEYMKNIGNTNFAGGIASQAGTMKTVMGDTEDAWFRLWKTISETGVGDKIKEGFVLATDALNEFTAMIASGQLQAYIGAIADKFDVLLDGVHNAIANITGLLSDAFQYWGTDGKGAVDFIIDAFVNMPENIKAVVQGIGASLGLIVEYGIAVGKGVYQSIVGAFVLIWEEAKNLGNELVDQITHPFSEGKFNFIEKQRATFANFGKDVKQSWNEAGKSIDNATDAWQGVVTEIMDERDASINSFKDKISAADKLREAYDKIAAAKQKAGEKVMATSAAPRGNDTASEEQRRQFEQLRQSLQLEEKTIQESYKKRRELILNNTKGNKELELQLTRELDQQVEIEMATSLEKRYNNVEDMQTKLFDAQASGRDRKSVV